MNKKTIIMLVCAIALFILGIAIFLYATNQNKLESKSNNETTANQGNEIDSQKNEFGFYDFLYLVNFLLDVNIFL